MLMDVEGSEVCFKLVPNLIRHSDELIRGEYERLYVLGFSQIHGYSLHFSVSINSTVGDVQFAYF